MVRSKGSVQKSGESHCSEGLREWLRRIAEALQSLPVNEENREKIEKWCTMRQTTLETLKELLKSIQSCHDGALKCQMGGEIVSLVSDTLSVVSGLLSILGYIKSETASSVGDCGKVGGLLGSVISTTACGTKNIIEQQQADKAASILKDDMEQSEELLECFKPSQELKETIDEVMDFELFCKIMDGFETVYTEAIAACSGPSAIQHLVLLPDDIEKVVDYLPVTKEKKEEAKEVLSIIYTCYRCREYFLKIVKFRKENPLVLHISCLLSRFGLRFLGNSAPSLATTVARGAIAAYGAPSGNATCSSPSVGAEGGFSSLHSACEPSRSTAKAGSPSAASGVVFPAIFCILDIINVLATSKELNEKNLELVKRIGEYVKIMNEELKVLKSFQERHTGSTYPKVPETTS